ncbi:MAG TPA: ATP-binding protein, partial [Planctomycetota bacterium]|nr:ATP-binding protein [Planctomycetota bacterium]
EVDFLVRGAATEELIQVCADASEAETAVRELRGLDEARQAHPRARLRLLVAMRDGLPKDLPTWVTAQTVYEWLLGPEAS